MGQLLQPRRQDLLPRQLQQHLLRPLTLVSRLDLVGQLLQLRRQDQLRLLILVGHYLPLNRLGLVGQLLQLRRQHLPLLLDRLRQ